MAETKKRTSFFKGLKGEFKKITWPKIDVLMKQSIIVIIVSVVIGAIIAGIDFCYTTGIHYLIGR